MVHVGGGESSAGKYSSSRGDKRRQSDQLQGKVCFSWSKSEHLAEGTDDVRYGKQTKIGAGEKHLRRRVVMENPEVADIHAWRRRGGAVFCSVWEEDEMTHKRGQTFDVVLFCDMTTSLKDKNMTRVCETSDFGTNKESFQDSE
uniref:PPM-type phosphatase domain-containing protein n=1 Tax=Steinernema glaseri TaxID=37863 RepID=A0A1I7ZRE0_9BILA